MSMPEFSNSLKHAYVFTKYISPFSHIVSVRFLVTAFASKKTIQLKICMKLQYQHMPQSKYKRFKQKEDKVFNYFDEIDTVLIIDTIILFF